MNNQLSTKTLAYLALLAATAIWGGAAPAIKIGLHFVPIFTLLFYRFLLVCIILLPFTLLELKRHPIYKSDLPTLILLGILGQTSILLIFAGLKYTTAIDSAILGAVAPILVIAGGHYFYRDKVNRPLEFGIALATLGTLVIVLEPAFMHNTSSLNIGHRVLGNLLVMAYNFSFAAYIILSKKVMGEKSNQVSQTLQKLHIQPLKHSYPPFIHTSIAFFVALVSFMPLMIMEAKGNFGTYNFSILRLETPGVLALIYLVIFSSIAAYLLFQWGLDNSRISDSAVFSYLGPIFTLPISFLILGEIPTQLAILGAAVIFTGVVVAEAKKRK